MTRPQERSKVLLLHSNQIATRVIAESMARRHAIACQAHSGGPRSLPRTLRRARPDALIFDPLLAGGPPTDFLRSIRNAVGPVEAVAYVPGWDSERAQECLAAGCAALVAQSSPVERLVEALWTVFDGGLYLDSAFESVRMPGAGLPATKTPPPARRSAGGSGKCSSAWRAGRAARKSPPGSGCRPRRWRRTGRGPPPSSASPRARQSWNTR